MRFKWTKRIIALIVTVLTVSMLFAACGSEMTKDEALNYGQKNSGADVFGSKGPFTYYSEVNPDAEPGETATGNKSDSATVEQKIIKNVDISAETEEFDKATEQLEGKLKSVDGYIESMDFDGNTYSSSGYRSTRYVLRVPADRLERFLDGIGGIFKIYSRSERQQNITTQYVDAESRLKSLETEQTALLELLEKAKSISEILEIQDRLSQVRGSIESYKGQLKVYDSQVSYSTISLYLREVRLVSSDADSGFFTRSWERLKKSFMDISDGAVEFGVWFIGALPYFAIIAVIALIVLAIVKASIRRSAAKAKKNAGKAIETAGEDTEKGNN